MYDSRWHGQLRGWLASLILEDEVRHDVSYEDVFSGLATEITSTVGCRLLH